jgi:hypothetical protein
LSRSPGFPKSEYCNLRDMQQLIDFPFDRGKLYPLADLNRFSDTLADVRQKHPKLGEAIRARSIPWAKLWCEELWPVKLFADGDGLSADTKFKIMNEGDPVDVELHSSSGVTGIQITLAYPDWDSGTAKCRNPGYVASMERQGTNQKNPVFLGGDIIKSAGRIISNPRVRDDNDDRVALEAGLRKAMAEKLTKAERYIGKADILLVYASRLRYHLNYSEPSSFVIPIITNELNKSKYNVFKKVIIADDDPLGYVAYSP